MIADFFQSVLSTAAKKSPRFLNVNLENPALSLHDPKTWEGITGGIESEAGVRVDHWSALELAPLFQGVALISGDMAGLQLNCYKRLADDDRQINNAHPAQYLTSMAANAETSAFEFRRRLIAHAILWGNGLAWIERDGSEPVGLYNLLPDRTAPYWHSDGRMYYVTEVDGVMYPLLASEVLHVKGLSLEVGLGLDLIECARNSVGLGLAAQGFASKFFSQGCTAGGVLEVPATFSEKAAANLEEGFRKRTAGGDNWFKTVVLREGAKFHQTTIDPQKSQTHELRGDQARDVARFLNLPPFKLGLEDSVSYNSAEMAQRIYLTHCLNHWRMAEASECNMKLLTEEERRKDSHYFEHNVSNFLEIDFKTMNEVLAIQRQNGFINGREARKKLNLPKADDPSLDSYDNPNTTPGGQTEEVKKEEPKPEPKDLGSLRFFHEIFRSDLERFTRRACHEARTEAKKPARFLAWTESRGHDLRKPFAETMGPVVRGVAGCLAQDASELLDRLESRFFVGLLAKLSPLVDPPHTQDKLAENVDTACSEFESGIVDLLFPLVFPEPKGTP